MIMTDLADYRSKMVPDPPPIFCEANKPVWSVFRRLMIALLRMLDEAYGWRTFDK